MPFRYRRVDKTEPIHGVDVHYVISSLAQQRIPRLAAVQQTFNETGFIAFKYNISMSMQLRDSFVMDIAPIMRGKNIKGKLVSIQGLYGIHDEAFDSANSPCLSVEKHLCHTHSKTLFFSFGNDCISVEKIAILFEIIR
jgi:hypothetical protein